MEGEVRMNQGQKTENVQCESSQTRHAKTELGDNTLLSLLPGN